MMKQWLFLWVFVGGVIVGLLISGLAALNYKPRRYDVVVESYGGGAIYELTADQIGQAVIVGNKVTCVHCGSFDAGGALEPRHHQGGAGGNGNAAND